MQIHRIEWNTVFGTVHVACFLNLCGSEYDYPRKAIAKLQTWPEGQEVFTEVGSRPVSVESN